MSISARRGRIVTAAVLATLIALAFGLAAANLTQGPRLRAADVSADLVVSRTDQRLVLRLNQPVEAVTVSDVTVTPTTGFDASAQGNAVTLRFAEALHYGTTYAVRARVTSAATGMASVVDASFATADPPVYTLARGADGEGTEPRHDDRILAHRTGDPAASRDVFAADTIRGFADAGDELLVVTERMAVDAPASELAPTPARAVDGRISELRRVPVGGAAEPDRPLIELGRLAQVRADERAGIAGVVGSGVGADGVTYDRTLFTIDLATGAVDHVSDEHGERVVVDDWAPVPGSGAFVLQDAGGAIRLFESFPSPRVTDLGLTGALAGISADGRALSVRGADGALGVVDLAGVATGDAALPLTATGSTLPDPAPGAVRTPLTAAHAIDVTPPADGRPAEVVSITEDGAEVLFMPAADGTRITRACASGNGEFAAVTTADETSGSEATQLLPLTGGASPRAVLGGSPSWCA